eukprot:TRINITY_DN16568_c0_g1_i1.p1 TRINITY_DN16568_c0_g1~~TRINITY_DN16568_c0_g1_i1.p1  ORF type:complete len:409 (-),score=42.49 TRINITY_DN16568_c0_g1_i1:22-1248(-)
MYGSAASWFSSCCGSCKYYRFFLIVWVRKGLKAAELGAVPLYLDGMSLYSKEFQLLLRHHFNQILRMRRSVPPRDVDRRALVAHLLPETLVATSEELETSQSTVQRASLREDLLPLPLPTVRLGIRFKADLREPCMVRLYWGVPVSACNDFLRHHCRGGPTLTGNMSPRLDSGQGRSQRSVVELEHGAASLNWSGHSNSSGSSSMSSSGRALFDISACAIVTKSYSLGTGIEVSFETPSEDLLQATQLSFDLYGKFDADRSTDPRPTHIPLVISVLGASSASGCLSGQLTLVTFRRDAHSISRRALQAEVLQQLTIGQEVGHGWAYKVLGIYGFESVEGSSSSLRSDGFECTLCYDRQRNVVLLPCRHCSVCSCCLKKLRDELCPLCRTKFSAHLELPLRRPAMFDAA